VLTVLLVSVLAFATSCIKDTVSPITPTDSGSAATPVTKSPITLNDAASSGTVYVPSRVIDLNGAHDLIISGKSIKGGMVPCITLNNCYNITITANKLYNSSDVGIYLCHCKNITVENNYITGVSTGVYVLQTTAGGIVVDRNQFLNMLGPFPRGQFVQFNNVSGPNNSIERNRCVNILGQSYPEDGISLYQSHGIAGNRIVIMNNWISGGGPSKSGGGIMLGDAGGSYLTAFNNILVNPGQYGIAIAGGDHNSIVHNFIYGKSQSFTNIGIYVDGIGGYPVTNSKVAENSVNFFNSSGISNNAWLAPGIDTPAGWSTNIWGDHNITPAMLPSNIITFNN